MIGLEETGLGVRRLGRSIDSVGEGLYVSQLSIEPQDVVEELGLGVLRLRIERLGVEGLGFGCLQSRIKKADDIGLGQERFTIGHERAVNQKKTHT